MLEGKIALVTAQAGGLAARLPLPWQHRALL